MEIENRIETVPKEPAEPSYQANDYCFKSDIQQSQMQNKLVSLVGSLGESPSGDRQQAHTRTAMHACRQVEEEQHRNRFGRRVRSKPDLHPEFLNDLDKGIAHDLNNYLCLMIGYTELAMLELDEETGAYSNLKQVLVTAKSAAAFINKTLINKNTMNIAKMSHL